ncbi:hypothetical protein AVEN_88242-1 [Araneus ventricosus]|uniref:Uncharacterized protein n=1 Tax=Araneus ventricosus TaxID=182803 RepID=A0A4Y2IPF9_ARAVE|nr:hypothetical protein AVEN_88242-1 [Araneus ventricosus]
MDKTIHSLRGNREWFPTGPGKYGISLTMDSPSGRGPPEGPFPWATVRCGTGETPPMSKLDIHDFPIQKCIGGQVQEISSFVRGAVRYSINKSIGMVAKKNLTPERRFLEVLHSLITGQARNTQSLPEQKRIRLKFQKE